MRQLWWSQICLFTIKVAQTGSGESNDWLKQTDIESSKPPSHNSAIMKISVIVLVSYALISSICCAQASRYAQSRKALQKEQAELKEVLVRLQQDEEESAEMQQGIWQEIKRRFGGGSSNNQPRTAYCYGDIGCNGALLGTGTAAFCCTAQGGRSFRRTGQQTCHNCS